MNQRIQRWTNTTLQFVTFITQTKDTRAAAVPLNDVCWKLAAF